MSTHHQGIARVIDACADVSELLDMTETFIRTSRLLGNVDAAEAAEYHAHVQRVMQRVQLVRASEVDA